jgi:hypothetical protein
MEVFGFINFGQRKNSPSIFEKFGALRLEAGREPNLRIIHNSINLLLAVIIKVVFRCLLLRLPGRYPTSSSDHESHLPEPNPSSHAISVLCLQEDR